MEEENNNVDTDTVMADGEAEGEIEAQDLEKNENKLDPSGLHFQNSKQNEQTDVRGAQPSLRNVLSDPMTYVSLPYQSSNFYLFIYFCILCFTALFIKLLN
jgi:hypothetical protein